MKHLALHEFLPPGSVPHFPDKSELDLASKPNCRLFFHLVLEAFPPEANVGLSLVGVHLQVVGDAIQVNRSEDSPSHRCQSHRDLPECVLCKHISIPNSGHRYEDVPYGLVERRHRKRVMLLDEQREYHQRKQETNHHRSQRIQVIQVLRHLGEFKLNPSQQMNPLDLDPRPVMIVDQADHQEVESAQYEKVN